MKKLPKNEFTVTVLAKHVAASRKAIQKENCAGEICCLCPVFMAIKERFSTIQSMSYTYAQFKDRGFVCNKAMAFTNQANTTTVIHNPEKLLKLLPLKLKFTPAD